MKTRHSQRIPPFIYCSHWDLCPPDQIKLGFINLTDIESLLDHLTQSTRLNVNKIKKRCLLHHYSSLYLSKAELNEWLGEQTYEKLQLIKQENISIYEVATIIADLPLIILNSFVSFTYPHIEHDHILNKTESFTFLKWMITQLPKTKLEAVLSRLDKTALITGLLTPGSKGRCALDAVAKRFPMDLYQQLLNFIYENPDIVRQIKTTGLKMIDLSEQGYSRNSWAHITQAMIGKIDATDTTNHHQLANIDFLSMKGPTLDKPIDLTGLSLLRFQGRTILLTDDKGHILALKIRKKNEDINNLIKECNTLYYLNEHAKELSLKSKFPTPLGVTQIPIRYELVDKMHTSSNLALLYSLTYSAIDDVFVYRVTPENQGYFTYLQDFSIPDETFQTANFNVVHDLITLFKHGMIFTQLADLFHANEIRGPGLERDDQGRYLVLVELLRRGWLGSGCNQNWERGIKYPNVRATGLADLGDHISINELKSNTEYTKKLFGVANVLYPESQNYILANVLAEYQYVLFLIAGKRALDLTKKCLNIYVNTNYEIWHNAALHVLENCALTVSLLTSQSKDQAKIFLSSMIDINRLAKQMCIFLSDEYCPINVYGENVSVNIPPHYTVERHEDDLGALNGQEPIKEANKLFYWMITSIFRDNMQLDRTFKDVYRLANEPNLERSEKLRKNVFKHLPSKPFHAIQRALCEKRLEQAIPVKLAKKIKTELEDHKRKHAVATISTFWKNKNEMERIKEYEMTLPKKHRS